MDIGLAITYVTRDPDWIKKLLIGGLIFMISIPLMFILVGFLGLFVVYGYAIATTRNVINGAINPLPEWTDYGAFLSSGFKGWIGVFLWSLPVIVLSVCNQGLGSLGDTASYIAIVISICLVLPLNILISVFVMPTIVGRFAATDDLGSMLQVSDVLAQIRSIGVGPYLLFFVLSLIAGFIGLFGIVACVIGIFFTSVWALLIQAHGIGQLYRLQTERETFVVISDAPAF